jgi:hypothetical protein
MTGVLWGKVEDRFHTHANLQFSNSGIIIASRRVVRMRAR